jgi:O-succinylbenzoate synthase
VRASIPVNALVPAVSPDDAATLALAAVRDGIRTVKVKVGDAAGLDRVAAVRATVGSDVRLRVDGNEAWDVEAAAAALTKMAHYDVELAEQPVRGLDDLARLRRLVPMPLAADESVRSVDDARRSRALGAADVVVLKVQPLGGVRAALRVAEASGVPAIVTSMMETSIGLAAGVALAACLPELPYACGLATATFFAAEVVRDPLLAIEGAVAVRRPAADLELLGRYAAG